MTLPTIAGEFTIVADPEIRFSGKGNAWAKIRGVAKDRVRDSNGTWADGDPLYIDIIVGNGAEHLIESVAKGDSIIVTGKLKQREFEYNGEKRVAYQINADNIGPSTRWGQARTKRAMESTMSPSQVQESFDSARGEESQDTEAPF